MFEIVDSEQIIKELREEIARLQSALDVAVEGLDAISKKYPQVGDCMTYPELASAALWKIKQIKATTEAKRHMELSKVLDDGDDDR